MKKEIEDWWVGYDLPVSEVIRIGMRGNPQLTKPAIQAAIEAVYKENNPDLVLPRYKLAKTAWRYAKVIEASNQRDVHIRKYDSERKELVRLRTQKIKYEQIRNINIHDLAMLHGPYWVVILSIVGLIYFLGV